MNKKILVAEDDKDIRELLKLYFTSENFEVLEAENGKLAFEIIENEAPDLGIFDIMMPEMNGLELTRAIREKNNMPVIILSAKDQDNDKILGLNIGADDYITKPFNPLEVVARVKALLRRSGEKDSSLIKVGELTLDVSTYTLKKNNIFISTTPMEYKILAKLASAPGRVFTKAQLYESINGDYFESDDNTMMVHISRLREKIEDDPKNPKYIITVRGVGYKLEK